MFNCSNKIIKKNSSLAHVLLIKLLYLVIGLELAIDPSQGEFCRL